MGMRSIVLAGILLASGLARADKGHIWPSPVTLAESAQRAIILHNRGEEILILGVDLKADKEMDILEFIPFPSEPRAGLAPGDPFARVNRLIKEKRLEFAGSHPVKGQAGGSSPVELRFSARIGAHDVTVVKVNDATALETWVRTFFQARGIQAQLELGRVRPVAEAYLAQGCPWFVFDLVHVGKETRSIEPLAYRFKSPKIYYPLQDSNIVGGSGVVDLILVLPGSMTFEFSHRDAAGAFWKHLRGISSAPNAWSVSSSAKLKPEEVEAIHPGGAAFFGKNRKIYLQVIEYMGEFRFKGDLNLDPGWFDPWALKFPAPFDDDLPFTFWRAFTEEERQDYCEAHPGCPGCSPQGRPDPEGFKARRKAGGK